MPPAEIFVAHTAQARIERAAAFLRALPGRSRTLILAPSLSSATALCHRVLSADDPQAPAIRFGWFRRTLDMFANELAARELAARGWSVLRGLGVEALVARVAHECIERQALVRYHGVASRPGFVRALAATLAELRMAGVEAAPLAEHDPDLSLLLAGYEEALLAAGLTDRAGLLAVAAGAAASASLPVGDPLLVLDACLAHVREAELLGALARRASETLLTSVHGDERTRALLEQSLPGARVAQVAPALDSDLELVAARLFEAGAHAGVVPAERGNVAIVSSPGEGREAVELARRVLAAARAGVPFDRMAIALRATATYRAVLEEALSRAQIPAHFADGVERPHPEGRALLALLECARSDLSARAFAEYVSLGVMPPRPGREEGEAPVKSPRHWEKLLVNAAVMGGRARWERRLDGLARELVHERDLLQKEEPRWAILDGDLEALEELRAFALPMLDLLAALPRSATWGAWLGALEALARAALGSPDHVCEILSELAPLAPIGPVSLPDVLRLLGRRLPGMLVRSEAAPAGKLFVGAIDDLLGRSFDVVFVPGLAEKLFPPRVLEDPLLPDRVRRVLSRELPCREDAAQRERLLLRSAVGAARRQLVVSFPRFDLVNVRPRVPSFYGLELLRALDGKLPAFDELSRRAHPGAAARMGFPAPERAEDAIDDAEYDLAMLDVLLRAAPEAQRGAAVYLLRANAHLARALRFRARRWMLGRFTPADGFVAVSDAERELSRTYATGQKAHSPTALAALAACPYKFFLHAVMRLAPREEVEPQDELDARQRGILVHAVQRGVLAELRERGLLPLAAQRLAEARAILSETFEEEAARAREEFAPAIEGVFRDALRAAESDLEEWLARLVNEPRFVPAHFELGFGVPARADHDPASTPDEVLLDNGMRQKGVIDLVERAELDGRVVLRATDFKTGAVPEQLKPGFVTAGGRTLQPILYALSLERLFQGATVAGGRLYFCTSRAGFASHEVRLDEHTRSVARDLAQSSDALILSGFLPAAPALKECERCPFQAVCGPYEELRVASVKRGELARLAPLMHLRNLP
jgi:ATP-dependent helicase/nuclease subunit B